MQGNSCRAILIGVGRRGRNTLLPVLQADPRVRVTGLVDTPEVMARLTSGGGLDVPLYSSLDQAITTARPQLAVIATPHDSHVALAAKLAAAGAAVMIEKPIARTGRELRQLLAASDSHRSPVAAILPLRHDPRVRPVLDRLCRARTSPVEIRIVAEVATFPGSDGWRLSLRRCGGGVLIDLGYHYLDLLAHALGWPDASRAVLIRAGASQVETAAEVRLRYRRPPALVHAAFRVGARLNKRAEITVDGETADLSPPAAPPLYARQLDALLSEGFAVGNGQWRTRLREQLRVARLIDHLYATARRVTVITDDIW